MPKSRVWPSQLPVGTPVMVHFDDAPGDRVLHNWPQRVAGKVVKVEENRLVLANGRWRYLVETSKVDAQGYTVAHWWPEGQVHPVDMTDQAQMLEWLDG